MSIVISYLILKNTEKSLNYLAILTIESDFTKKFDYDDIIDIFTNEKDRVNIFNNILIFVCIIYSL